MDEKIYSVFAQTIKANNLISGNEVIICGISGGADSVALLLLLDEYNKRTFGGKLKLRAAHFNHQIRGAEADEDEEFVKKLCEELKIPFDAGRGDVPGLAKEQKMSLEEAARQLRYESLEHLADIESLKYKNVLIAVAHTENDRAETVLANIARGTSIDGLKGIAVKRGRIIRPAIELSREETEKVCSEAGIKYRLDSTNTDLDYTRNKIRHEILPYLSSAFGLDFPKSLISLSELAVSDNDYMAEEAEKQFIEIVSKDSDGNIVIDGQKLLDCHPAISSRVTRRALSNIVINGNYVFKDGTGLTRDTISRVINFIKSGKGGKYVELGGGAACMKTDAGYILGTKNQAAEIISRSAPSQEFAIIMNSDGSINHETAIASNGVELKFTAEVVTGWDAMEEVVKACRAGRNDVVVFDRDDLQRLLNGGILQVRFRREGDTFVPYGMHGGKLLRRFLTDCKVPINKRDVMPVLACGSTVLHIFNLRRSNFASVHGGTACALIIRLSNTNE